MSSGRSSRHTEVMVLHRSQIDEQEWNAFIERSPQGVNYVKTWYLDVVWSGWQGIMVYYKGRLSAVMPLRVSRKYGISYCLQPQLSQYGGIFFSKITGKTEKAYALKKRLVSAVVEAVPGSLRKFAIHFAPEFDYPLPFHWSGYELQIRYSYWLDHHPNAEVLFSNLNERTRTYINKAGKSGLQVESVEDISPVIALNRDQSGYSFDDGLLRDLWSALRLNGVGKALEVRDEAGRLHAALIYQVSGDKQIHLFSVIDPEVRSQGGMSFAIWHSITGAGSGIRIHDFEGSMLEPVEKFFRGFGTYPVPYLRITRNRLPGIVKKLTGG